ncbi:MAG TPA: hypothetical protein VGF60_03800 [Xanthobacteraceae bacterium]|jgi:hypothetical protein
MYLIAFPLLLIPFALYNMIVFLLNAPLTDAALLIPLAADRQLPVTTGDLLVGLGMLLLYVEVLKAARLASKSIMDHALSLVLFLAMAAELALVPHAASSVLLLLTVLSFVDLITGISLSGRKQPQIALEGADQARL